MTMKIVNLIQGSTEWHAHRAEHFNASDAPPMMSCSSYKTRSELIKELATGIAPEVDAATQSRFDDGHQFEALARPIAEGIIGEDLSPCVGTRGKYSASFDGITFMGDTAFEHKTLNAELRELLAAGCTGSDLPLMYQVQMEQQAMVSGCERILFMASKWEREDTSSEWSLVEEQHCWYEPNAELRAQIIAGWEQMALDVAAYNPESAPAKSAPQVKIRQSLPALKIEVKGEITASTMGEFKSVVMDRLNDVNMDLVTDQHFADADADAKWLRDVSMAMKQAGKQVRADMSSVDEVLNTLEQLDKIATQKAIDLEKRVKTEKDVRKQQIVMAARDAFDIHIGAMERRLEAVDGRPCKFPMQSFDFAGVIKGLKSLDSMQDKVTVALTNAKLEASGMTDLLESNRRHLIQDGQDWIGLFADFWTVGQRGKEDFQMLASHRIGQHKKAEADRLEEEREKIRAEEAAKLQREAEAKARAEAAEAEKKLQQEREQIRKEEQEKARAEAQKVAAEQAMERQKQLQEKEAQMVAQGVLVQKPEEAEKTVSDSAPKAADTTDEVMTMGQINAALAAIGAGKISADTLDFHGITFERERGAVKVKKSDSLRLYSLMAGSLLALARQ